MSSIAIILIAAPIPCKEYDVSKEGEIPIVFKDNPRFFVYNTGMEKDRPLTLRYRTLLAGVKEAKEKGYELSPSGISALLIGNAGDALPPDLKNLRCYGYWGSKKSKAIKNMVHLLLNHGYLRLSYEEGKKEPFLILASKAMALSLPTLERKERAPREKMFRKSERNDL